ncbi:TPA: hypothetical protein JZG60_004056 [Escherichia coli]|nr:hypothetical protein [Escherichia coli]
MLNDVCPVRRGRMGRGSLHGADGIYPRARRWQGGSQPPGKAVGRVDTSKDVKIRNAELHELWQQADALPDEEQRALIMVIDSFVTKVNVEKAVKKSVRQR